MAIVNVKGRNTQERILDKKNLTESVEVEKDAVEALTEALEKTVQELAEAKEMAKKMKE